nr:unnamed protein product [Callosobruchus chinensis]
MCKVTTFVPRTTGAETKDDVMLGLKSQSGLDTDHWAVVGGNTTPEGELLVIHVDEASLQKLRSLGMRPFLGAERVPFKLQGGVVLIQEPWTVKGRVMGMSTAKGKLIYDTQCDKPRACVFVNNNIKALKITDLCSRDTAVTEVHLQTEHRTGYRHETTDDSDPEARVDERWTTPTTSSTPPTPTLDETLDIKN